MHEYPVTQGVLALAQKKALLIPSNLNNSIRKGGGILVGCIGEVIFSKVMDGTAVEPENPYNYDVIVGDKTYDVKTKECTSPPRSSYFASVAAANTKQKCDFYTFMRVMRPKDGNYIKAWLIGYLPKEEFYDKAIFYREGDVDPDSTFGWQFRADCYNIAYSELRPFITKVEGRT